MTTARESLYEEMVQITQAPAGDDAGERVKKIMLRYRVQTKPGVNTPEGSTARDDLGERLLAIWRELPADKDERIGTEIDKFRMQSKQKGPSAGGAKKAAAAKKPPAAAPTGMAPPRPAPGQKAPPSASALSAAGAAGGNSSAPGAAAAASAAGPGPAPGADDHDFDAFGGGRRGLEPVAGGPRRRGKTRSECPKCHSMGVVLARSYAGDEYYSCIYCGWQAFKPADENDPTASLAGRLLGQSSGKS